MKHNPVGYLFEMLYPNGTWSGKMFSPYDPADMYPNSQFRNVQALYPHPYEKEEK